MKKVRTVIWDLDDTVWFYKKEEPKILCQKLNIGEEEQFEKEFFKALGTLFMHFKDKIVTYDGVKSFIAEEMPILKSYGVSVENFLDTLSAEKNAIVDVNKEAIEMMEYFKSRGINNIAITDWFVQAQEEALASLNAGIHIEKIYGCDNTYFKSSIGKIAEIVEKLELEEKREEYVMIGDSLLADIFFAEKLGIKSVWYNPKRKQNTTNHIPTLEVQSLLELKQIL